MLGSLLISIILHLPSSEISVEITSIPVSPRPILFAKTDSFCVNAGLTMSVTSVTVSRLLKSISVNTLVSFAGTSSNESNPDL